MPTTEAQIKTDYPLPVYNYRVEIGTTAVAFSEVSGLELSYETIIYKESRLSTTDSPNTIYMPGMLKPVYINLKKGYVKGKNMQALYKWIDSIRLNVIEKKNITIHLCDETGTSVVRWVVSNAFPIKLSAPNFNASSDDVAIDSMELMASNVRIAED